MDSKCTFKEFLTELMVSDDPQQAMMDVRMAAKNPDRYQKQKMRDNVEDQREIQKSDDPQKAEKLRLAKLQQAAAMQRKKIVDKEKQAEREAGIQGDTGERPMAGMSS